MRKRITLLIIVILCSNFMFVNAGNSNSVIDVKNELIPISKEPLKLVVEPVYECYKSIITNVTYTAYVSSAIPEGSTIDFYTGNTSDPYPTTLLGSSYVKGGKAVFKTYQKINTYYLGSAVWTKPSNSTAKIPPTRIYSNIVTYKVQLSNKLLDLDVTVKNTTQNNVTYTANFTDPIDALTAQNKIIDPAIVNSNSTQMDVKFSTFAVPSELDVKTLDEGAISKISAQSPYRVDYATIYDWTAEVNIKLPAGKYIVLAECSGLTSNYGLELFNVTTYIIATPKTTIIPGTILTTKIPATATPKPLFTPYIPKVTPPVWDEVDPFKYANREKVVE